MVSEVLEFITKRRSIRKFTVGERRRAGADPSARPYPGACPCESIWQQAQYPGDDVRSDGKEQRGPSSGASHQFKDSSRRSPALPRCQESRRTQDPYR